jgi:hypothetical protein
MRGYAIRTIVAVIAFLLFIYVLPLLFTVLGLTLSGAAFQLIKICAAIVALVYIVWGTSPTQ